jgi:dihydroorotate dehydrogenase (NAD+) catalytic subunit
MVNALATTIATIEMQTPVMTASGTSGSSNEVESLRQSKNVLQSLGAFVTKSVTLEPRTGNPEHRVMEVRAGLINSIGLQNSGARVFVREELPRLSTYELPIIVNISASSVEEFGRLAGYLCESDQGGIISGIEINVSCPNINEGGVAFGVNPRVVERIVKTVRKNVAPDTTVITKLTPNVTDITLPARAAIAGGCHALSMINTLRGMAINIETQQPFLGGITGGLSGPAIKPVGLFMVFDCYRKIRECQTREVPIIGIGGISCWQDAAEYIMAGASAVGIGTAWFVNTRVFCDIVHHLGGYLDKRKMSLTQLVGVAHSKERGHSSSNQPANPRRIR